MLFILTNILVLGFALGLSWWLSGFDAKLTGESQSEGRIRRSVRCGITLIFVEVAFYGLWRYWRYDDRSAGFLYILTVLPLAFIWVGCISEALAHVFHWLIDPQDDREYDPKKGLRELDAIGDLIRNGRKEEAIKMCMMLKETSHENRMALELTLHHLGVPQEQVKERKPLAEAAYLRREGKFAEAEMILNSLLLENPSNMDAGMMLMRLHAQDMRRWDKAMEVLRSLEKQPHISSTHIEFARRSIQEWQKSKPKEVRAEPMPKTIDELLAGGYFGTAIEILETQITEEPENFDVWLKLAEVHGQHCGNLQLAEKMIKKIRANPTFRTERIEDAQRSLKKWQEAKGKPPMSQN